MSYLERFTRKIETPRNADGCWNWTGAPAPTGYGKFYVSGLSPQLAHRVSYEMYVGKIPAGLEIDHLCRNRRCVRPDHLEAVTGAENTRRRDAAGGNANSNKTHCRQGHAYDAANAGRYKARRICRICQRAADARWKAAHRNKSSS